MKSELYVPSDLSFVNTVENWLLAYLKQHLRDSLDWSNQSSRLRLALV